MYKVVFIGSNPSERSSSVVPFWHDTSSNKILSSWIGQIDVNTIESFHYLNVANYVTPGNRPLKISEIKMEISSLRERLGELGDVKIIALGNSAQKAMTLMGVDFFAMPHPSGLNRQLNNLKYVEEKIKGLRFYLSPSTIEEQF